MTTLHPAHPFAASFLSASASPAQVEPPIPLQPQPQPQPQPLQQAPLQPVQPPAPGTATVQDGLYRGSTRYVQIEVRVDHNGSGVISGDLWRLGADKPNYVASFRTAPGERVTSAAEWIVFGQDEFDRRSQGQFSLTPDAAQPTTLLGRIEFSSPLEGLPVRRAVPFIVERVSGAFRQLGLEIEIEDGVTPPGRHTIDGRATTIESALQAAGIEVSTSGVSDRIPRLEGGWQMAQLHTLMSDLAQSPMDMRTWHLRLLLLSKSDRSGLLGVMFDSADALPRQGCAVFVDEIRGIQGIDHERKLIQTTVHELGHALNLAHRFERVVGRADSTSFMNYDWRYRGGSRQHEFWNHFQFTFDTDELEFLRHAPMGPVIPGGAAFHSAVYWADGNGGYSPYVPEAQLAGWRLTITPANDRPVLHFAEPVMLRTVLTNTSNRAVEVPKFLLDPKAGFIEISIRRVHAGSNVGMTGATSFAPVMQRCFQWDAADDMRLNPGESMEDDVNLTFGSGGFSFAEPGTYDVHALLVLYDNVAQRELVARSNTVHLRIAAPRSDEEERDALDFFVPAVGMYIALGGAPTLEAARGRIQNIVDRRGNDLTDPTVANLKKTMAFDDARTYVRYRNSVFVSETPGVEQAAKSVGELVANGAFAGDALTIGRMRDLADSCQAVVDGQKATVAPVAEPRRLSPAESKVRVGIAEKMEPPRTRAR